MIAVEEGLALVLQHTPLLPAEDVPLAQALGRVLRADACADRDLPPFDRAAMDGYALRAADAASAPVTLAVAGQLRAGQAPAARALAPGEAIEIMTGAPLPPGADAVLQVEKTRAHGGGSRVELLEPVAAGLNVAPRGSEARAGEVLLVAGRTIDPAALAVLATLGLAQVHVGRRPRVFVLATGDELVDPSETPGPGRIRDSNGVTVAALARLCGADVVALGIARDALEPLVERLAEGLRGDVLLVSGGVSAGAFDLVEPALARLGARVVFDKVALKPGAPLVFALAGGALVFGLPGNPVSSQVTFELFVRPALLRLQGRTRVARPTVEAELLAPVTNRSRRRNHLPAALRFERGRFVARPIRSMGSADVRAHAQANALVVLEPERLRAEEGERVPAILLSSHAEGEEP